MEINNMEMFKHLYGGDPAKLLTWPTGKSSPAVILS